MLRSVAFSLLRLSRLGNYNLLFSLETGLVRGIIFFDMVLLFSTFTLRYLEVELESGIEPALESLRPLLLRE